ncbi:rubrerythrin [Clostridium homopropionicum DSM 5847]|uniref:Rubrerythrin n=1 Tax=Clostridium homopropionicum DSM 5847 TaxID=1121318 RepID=A0A0L6ZDN5_9CLOT|nr:ferritin-like domain-containing protein [Clostridium homopropionicum]KOA21091.1 rubrerythrin [Clostridium homopropionicum DSM 5847]SFF97517.1 Rubrerythrin [Clostridium homopropionicum]
MAYVRNSMEQFNMNNMNNMGSMVNMQNDLMESLALVEKAVQGEREDELFYDYLISQAPTQEEKDIIISIRDDERKHNRMFRKIFKDFTQRDVKEDMNEQFEKPVSYIDGVKKALMGELRAVETYRKIRQGIPYTYYRDMLFEIITDEIKHSIKYNYILNLNLMRKRDKISGKEVKEKVSRSVEKIGSTIGEKSNYAFEKAKDKFIEERILEDILIPGIVQGVKNVYFADKKEADMRKEDNFKQDIGVRYVSGLVENLLRKVNEKVDVEEFFNHYVIPEIFKDK